MHRENYFILLELDPAKDENNVAAIRARITACQNQWSQARNHPIRARKYQLLLAEIPRITALMANDVERQKEAAEASTLLLQRQAQALQEFDKLARIAAGQGSLTDVDVTALAIRFKATMTEADVRARAQKLGLKLRQGLEKQAVPRPRLDAAVEKRIEGNLKIICKGSLYDFLDVPPNTSAETLRAKAKERYTKVLKVAIKDAEVGALQALAGDCMKVFASEEEREKYDNTLAWAKLEPIRERVEWAGRGGCVPAVTMDQLIDEGKQAKLTAEEVTTAVREVARQRNWLVEVPFEPVPKTRHRCGACGELAAETVANCPRCGTPFETACPKCGTANSSESRYCGRQGCGFAIGDMPLGERALRDARVASWQGNAGETKRLLEVALHYCPGHAEAVRLEAEVQRRDVEEQKAVRAAEEAITNKALLEGQRALAELRRLTPQHPRLAALDAQVKEGLVEAAKHVAHARLLQQQGKSDDAIEAYCRALRACADFGPARDGLADCPPLPPGQLTGTVSPRAVALTWTASPSRGPLCYRVVRKARSEPTTPDDGDLIAVTPGTSLTDPQASPGLPLYYAVYAERGGVRSEKAAVAGPWVRVAEVARLQAKPEDAAVALEWQPPDNARSVEVWRQTGAVPRRDEGTPLQGVSLHSVRDGGLKNGTPYGYRVVVVFDGADGRPLYSEGETCSVVPAEPPKPATDLKVTRYGAHFEVEWALPVAGQVRVYSRSRPARHDYGELLPAAEADTLGTRVKPTGPALARGAVPGDGELHLVPVTILGPVAVVGRAVTVSWVDDVAGLTAQVLDGALQATWRYPDKIEMAFVAWRADAFPAGPEDPKATRVAWTRQHYQCAGGFRHNVLAAERVFLTVYAAVHRGSRWDYAAGRGVAISRKRIVRWSLSKPGWLSRKHQLTITPDVPTTLPDLILVAKRDGVPLSPAKGECVLRLAGGHVCDVNHPLVEPFEPPPHFASCHVRLFPERDSDYGWLAIDRV